MTGCLIMGSRIFIADDRADDMENVNQAVGDFLRSRREALGKSRQDVAAALHVTKGAVGNYERGQRAIGLDLLPDVAKAYGIRDFATTLAPLLGIESDFVPVAIDTTERYKELARNYHLMGQHREGNAVDYLVRHANGNAETPGRIVNVMLLTRPEYEAVTRLQSLINNEVPLDAYVTLLRDVMPRYLAGELDTDMPTWEEVMHRDAEVPKATFHEIVCAYCPVSSCTGIRYPPMGECMNPFFRDGNVQAIKDIVQEYAEAMMFVPDAPIQYLSYVPSVIDVLDRVPQEWIESFPDYDTNEYSDEELETMNAVREMLENMTRERKWGWSLTVWNPDGTIASERWYEGDSGWDLPAGLHESDYDYGEMEEVPLSFADDMREYCAQGKTCVFRHEPIEARQNRLEQRAETTQAALEAQVSLDHIADQEDADDLPSYRIVLRSQSGVPLEAWITIDWWEARERYEHLGNHSSEYEGSESNGDGWSSGGWEIWNGQVSKERLGGSVTGVSS